MKNPIKKAAAVLAVSAAMLFAAPVAANAVTIYPPAGSITASASVITPGGSITFYFAAGMFTPGEDVTITLTGESANSATFAAIETKTSEAGFRTALEDGSIDPVTVTVPSNASGTYTLAAFSSTSAGDSITFSVSADSDDGLAVTGSDSGMLLSLWIGGGALLLAGGAFVAATSVRRQRAKAAA